MPSEPLVKRTIAFIDGQNLYHATREIFTYTNFNFIDTKAHPEIFVVVKQLVGFRSCIKNINVTFL
jgi:hypothetical protein